MKCFIIGSCEREGVSKKTGKPYHMLNLYGISREARTFGFAVADLTIDYDSALLRNMEKDFKEAADGLNAYQDDGAFLGAYLEVDYNRSGYIDDITVLGYDPDALVAELDFRTFGASKTAKKK